MRRTYASNTPVDLDLNHFTLDHLALFGDSHADALPERLSQSLSLAHLQAEDLARGDHGERHVAAQSASQSLCHCHSEGSLAGRGRSRDQDSSTSNFPFLDHLQNDRGGLPGSRLADKALRRGLRFEGVWLDAETADVRMGGDEIETAQVARLGDRSDLRLTEGLRLGNRR